MLLNKILLPVLAAGTFLFSFAVDASHCGIDRIVVTEQNRTPIVTNLNYYRWKKDCNPFLTRQHLTPLQHLMPLLNNNFCLKSEKMECKDLCSPFFSLISNV